MEHENPQGVAPIVAVPDLHNVAVWMDEWFDEQQRENPAITAIERDQRERRWYVRVNSEEKGFFTVWFTLSQRTLRFETYVIGAPVENHAAFYEFFLRQNHHRFGLQFSIGEEDAIFLSGQTPVASLDAATMDWILGATYDAIERVFRPAMHLGFASLLGKF